MGMDVLTCGVILQVQDAFKVDLRDVAVVEECVGRGGEREKDSRCGEKEDRGEVCFDGGARGEDAKRSEGEVLCALEREPGSGGLETQYHCLSNERRFVLVVVVGGF